MKLEVIAKPRSLVASGSTSDEGVVALPGCASAPSAIAGDDQVMDVGDELVGQIDGGDAFRTVAGAPERHQQRRRAGVEIEIRRADDVGGRHRLDAAPVIRREPRRRQAPMNADVPAPASTMPQVGLGEQRREERSMLARRLRQQRLRRAQHLPAAAAISRAVHRAPAAIERLGCELKECSDIGAGTLRDRHPSAR